MNRNPAVRQHPRTPGPRRRIAAPAADARNSQRLVAAGRDFAARAGALDLASPGGLEMAATLRLEIARRTRQVTQWFAPAKQAAHAAHRAICRQENEALAFYREARRVLDAKLAAWRQGTDAGDDKPAGASLEGVSFREAWRAEVTDMLKLVRAVARNPALLSLLEINQAELQHLARTRKEELKLPGVRIWRESLVAATGA
jgi:hypothetical protein